jgi:hypothetical protein
MVAFLFLGLALWNRADFVWALAGLATAGTIVLWPEISRAFNRRNASLATISFLLGCLPLITYNIRRPNATLGANARLEFNQFSGQVRLTADGSDLFGYLVCEESDHSALPRTFVGRVAQSIRDRLGEHRHSGMAWALGASIVAVPLWWRSRASRFSIIFMTVTWISMAVTRGGGGSSHHVVMLWPFPQLFLACVLGRLRWRWVATATMIALVTLNLLVINQYLLQFDRDGPAIDLGAATLERRPSIHKCNRLGLFDLPSTMA